MIFQNMEFHNVAEIAPSPMGYKLYRFPRKVCDNMGEGTFTYGRYISQLTTGCEIRFVTEGDRFQFSFSSFDCDGMIHVFRGDYKYATYRIETGKVTHVMINADPEFSNLPSGARTGNFAPNVWRIQSGHDFGLTFVEAEHFGYSVRPPRPDEKPAKTLLAYGTSITHGACATSYPLSYTQYLGRLLHCDILNKGMGGSCMNEFTTADWFAGDDLKYDAILLENAVNMGEKAIEAYERNTAYLLKTLTRAHPDCPIYAVTAYPNSNLAGPDPSNPCVKREFKNDVALRRIASEYPSVHIIEGHEILDDFTLLQCDLVHLNDYGHIHVAQRLAERIGKI